MIAHPDASKPKINLMAFSADSFVEKEDVSTEDILSLRESHSVTWVDVIGLGNAETIVALGKLFGLHDLALEDVLNTHQRPKTEEFENHLFLVTRMYRPDRLQRTEQLSIFLGKGFVLSFQEEPGDCLEPVRKRIRLGRGQVRRKGADYLCYLLLDSVVDNYFPALEQYGESLEEIEENVLDKAESRHIRQLHDMKRELLLVRRSVWPQREMINAIIRDDNRLIDEHTRPYLRDVYDHTVQLMDILETYREVASGLVDVYISSVSAKLNEIMKVLTIISTIFIPLGFIASLYGMNFDRQSPWNMPELGWRFGYLFALCLMAAVLVGLLCFFIRKGWVNRENTSR